MRLASRPLTRLGLLVCLVSPSIAHGQFATTQQRLDSAITLYNNSQYEQAQNILKTILSPGYLQQRTQAEQILAYKYRGASWAVLNQPDSAKAYFVALLDLDPFADLEADKFAQDEQTAFAMAKQQIYKVGMRSPPLDSIDPNSNAVRFNFDFITTHAGNVKVELLKQSDTTQRETLWEGMLAGSRAQPWRGKLAGGGLASDSSVYMVRITGTSALQAGVIAKDWQLFRVEHIHDPLEEPFPAFTASDTLETQAPSSAAWLDVAKGASAGILASLLPTLALNGGQLHGWRVQMWTGVAVGLTSGIGSFYWRRSHRDLKENIDENARRQKARDDFNRAVAARNKQRLDATRLLITPLAR